MLKPPCNISHKISIKGQYFYPKNLFKNILLSMLTSLIDSGIIPANCYYLDLFLVRDSTIAKYNNTYLQCQGATNILSFPEEIHEVENQNLTSNMQSIGTLILSIDTLERECILYEQSAQEHLIRLLAHGLVHLFGYEHGEEMQTLTDLLEKNTINSDKSYTYTPLWSYHV